MAFYTATLK